MKPILLEITGFNSFKDKQVIDFNKLTQDKIFGIFGSTGCGKSSIINAMIIALYGKQSIESNNFINVNMDKADIRFKFQISGTTNRMFEVTRSFKRDKKNPLANKDTSKLVEFIEDRTEILADSTNEVKRICTELIGLTEEDFKRTVILPQGKFSEFLKLKGAERNEMLERIFELDEYGKKLEDKVKAKRNKVDAELASIEGQLKSFEGVSEEELEQKQQGLKVQSEEKAKLLKEGEQIAQRYEEAKEIWSLKQEQSDNKQKMMQLSAQKEEMAANEIKIKKAEVAGRINDIIEDYENGSRELTILTSELNGVKQAENNLGAQLKVAEKKYEAYKEKNSVLSPVYQTSQSELVNIADTISELIKIEEGDEAKGSKGIPIIIRGINKLKNEIGVYKEKAADCDKQLQAKKLEIVDRNEAAEALKIDAIYKEKIEKGLGLIRDYENVAAIVKELKNNNELLNVSIQKEEVALNECNKELEEYKENITKLNAEKEKMPPLVANEQILAMMTQLSDMQKILADAKELVTEIEEISRQQEIKGREQQAINKQIEEKTALVNEVKAKLDKSKMHYYSHLIRENLEDGSVCPVCGGVYHVLGKDNEETDEIKTLELKLEQKNKELDEVKADLVQIEMQIKTFAERKKELEKKLEALDTTLTPEVLKAKEEELAKAKQSNQEIEEKLKKLEANIQDITEQKNLKEQQIAKLKATLEGYKNQVAGNAEKLDANNKTAEALTKQINTLKQEVNAEDFNDAHKQIKAKEEQREILLEEVKRLEVQKEELQKALEAANHEVSRRNTSLSRGIQQFESAYSLKSSTLGALKQRLGSFVNNLKVHFQSSNSDNNSNVGSIECSNAGINASSSEILSILNNVVKVFKGNETLYEQINNGLEPINLNTESDMTSEMSADIEINSAEMQKLNSYKTVAAEATLEAVNQIKEEVINLKVALEDAYARAEAEVTDIRKSYSEIKEKLSGLNGQLETKQKQQEQDKEKLDFALQKEQTTIEEVKANVLSEEAVNALTTRIENYKKQVHEVSGLLNNIEQKLNGRDLTPEEWQNAQRAAMDIKAKIDAKTKEVITLEQEVKRIQKDLESIAEISKVRSKLVKQQDLVEALFKMLKGKAFVNFIANNKLKYVAKDASDRLYKISGRAYRLKVDENSDFVIVDNFNGGITRKANTLSGGETFLVSLSLALALSSQVQLKGGTAPIELFFLDEGFGTLDDKLLEDVMGTLETLSNDKLSVGIISHVEAVKNRVPRKLVLSTSANNSTEVKLEIG